MPIIPILIPKIGESVSEATITQWFKNIGDSVKKDEIFVEISTDKVTSELPSEYQGVITNIFVKAGESVSLNEPIAEMEISDADYEKFEKNELAEVEPKASKKVLNVDFQGDVEKQLNNSYLTPVVRKIAREENLSREELENIPATGANNRLTKKDVLAYVNQKNAPRPNNFYSEDLDLEIDDKDVVRPLTGIRKKAAEVLTTSYREIPHVTTIVEMDVSEMVKERNEQKKYYYDELGLKLTYTHYCFYAALKSLKKYPEFNSWFYDDEWILKHDVNFGFATSLPNDVLIVPNIKSAQRLNFQQFVSAVNEMAEKAKNSKLSPDDFSNTTITVSNTGIFGSLMGTPIITRPQTCVLALGAITDGMKWVENDKIEKCKKMYASLSYDHRVINGAMASKFLMEVQHQLVHLNFK